MYARLPIRYYIKSIMTAKLFLLVLLVASISANQYLNVKYRNVLEGDQPLTNHLARQMFEEFQTTREKTSYRFQIFYDNLKTIKQHNSEGHSWSQGVNAFTDLTFEEFVSDNLMEPQNCSATKSHLKIKEEYRTANIPDHYEWNDLGMVSPVKNQGNCGSCWTFSTVGAMESHWNILGKGKNLTFSEQQLVDCAGAFDNHGCNGGLPSHAFEYIKYQGGLESDTTYPYVAKTNKCVHKPEKNVAYCKYGSYNVTQGNEAEAAERLYHAGPVSVSFKVVTGFQNYKGGVYSNKNCGFSQKDVNHAVLATGYGV